MLSIRKTKSQTKFIYESIIIKKIQSLLSGKMSTDCLYLSRYKSFFGREKNIFIKGTYPQIYQGTEMV